ncbi:predicted protein [Postia placenta Mad-698-R]|uniref:Uncharacterized protein n=1 Tax=Postia placenta MAD-698-R-SB12 TaxID=670580 RepID=A0A1X6MP80_9APHY|nr:hypothetical protein POSPLADRAFT_1049465 [Postia placenta MAD-698-R-SB12]EED79790.1 predicted protein [Postia placenta Mad-698-R]OSX58224.1 hypothetical protein POSPLADRAFT_1049465 [Postia placenta MAD-698-R-SB12]
MLNWLAEALPQMPLDPIELPHLVREPNDIESNPVQNAPGHQSDRSIHSLEWTAEINTEVTSLRSRATGRTGAFNPTGLYRELFTIASVFRIGNVTQYYGVFHAYNGITACWSKVEGGQETVGVIRPEGR